MLYDKSIAFKRGQKDGVKKYSGSALSCPEAAVMLDYWNPLPGDISSCHRLLRKAICSPVLAGRMTLEDDEEAV